MSTLTNATEVLKLIARLRRDIGVMDVVNELGVPKSSASRTLSQMAEHGFLERDPATRAYRPGHVIMEASYHFRASRNIVSLLEEALEMLVRDSGFTGYINILQDSDSLVIHMRAGTGALQIYTPPGTRAPAHASSLGRAILSRLTDEEALVRVAVGLGKRIGQAPKSRAELLARLKAIRASGWELSKGEFVDNVAGIGASVVDPQTKQIYGIGIAFPSALMTDALAERLGPQVRNAAASVGKNIGDNYWLAYP
jgi:DNA-binding IclR family transcriptional regulator